MNHIRDDLVKIRELLAEPSRWTKGSFARSKSGKKCGHMGKSAVCWCLFGAIVKVAPRKTYCLRETIEKTLGWSITLWNDAPERNHQDVLDLLNKCIFDASK